MVGPPTARYWMINTKKKEKPKEGMTILEGVKLVWDLIFEHIVVELDSLCLVKFVNERSVPLTPFGFVVSDLLDVLRSF